MCNSKGYKIGIKVLTITLHALIMVEAGAAEWSKSEELERFAKQTHHWGQSGETAPNRGWSNYSSMRYDPSPQSKIYMLYKQANNEFLIELHDRATEQVVFKALSIPGAGIFYMSEKDEGCAPDPIENLGLQAELIQHSLALAFPSGPNSLSSLNINNVNTINVQPVEFRFMQGVMRMKAPTALDIKISSIDHHDFDFIFYIKERAKEFRVRWSENSLNSAVIPNDESIKNWATCWAGTFSSKANGKQTFRANIDTSNVTTFGDVRHQIYQLKQATPKLAP